MQQEPTCRLPRCSSVYDRAFPTEFHGRCNPRTTRTDTRIEPACGGAESGRDDSEP